MDIDYMLDDDKCCTLRNEFIDKNNPDVYDAWDAGWRAACEAMASRLAALTPPQPGADLVEKAVKAERDEIVKIIVRRLRDSESDRESACCDDLLYAINARAAK